jgi:hypothetical protein
MQHGFGPVDYDHTQMLAKVLWKYYIIFQHVIN